MPDTAQRPTETREMRLVDRLLQLSEDPDNLRCFIARRRHPDQGPLSWDQISFELAKHLGGEIVTDGTLRKWAAVYGIPDGGRNINLTKREYEQGLKAANISL